MPDRSPELKLDDDKSWDAFPDVVERVDPGVRLVASLIDLRDGEQLFRRTGLKLRPDGTVENPSLPLFVEIAPNQRSKVLASLAQASVAREGFSLSFASAYLEEKQNERLSVLPARLGWRQEPIIKVAKEAGGLRGLLARLVALLGFRRRQAPIGLRAAIAALLKRKGATGVLRVTLPSPLQPALQESLADLQMPRDRIFNGRKRTGSGVIVGIIDDGCAVAHPHFLKPGTLESRILFLWDQGATPVANFPYWTDPGTFPGRELKQQAINAALKDHSDGVHVGEDEVYTKLGYEIELTAHGTRVMDIAAGNGGSLMGTEGVASEADIIFVQLPRAHVEQGGPVLEDSILQGAKYIFDRAGSRQAVVNISFGGYCGPHDGTSPIATGMDELLEGATGRAIVVAAGNGFEADCHAGGTLPDASGAQSRDLVWLLRAENQTTSQMEVWYEGGAQLEVQIKPPNRPTLPGWVKLGERKVIMRSGDNQVMGWIQHQNDGATGKGSNWIRINLNATAGGHGALPRNSPGAPQQLVNEPLPPLTAPVPPGAWIVRLRNTGAAAVQFHAWIERDENRLGGRRRAQQSRFADADANPKSTVADLGTGAHVICVGAHNAATGEMCRYSACGPTRDGKKRPDLTAPAEETALGGGVLCASARRARPARMAGTSAAAPHVAGLVALIMEASNPPLTAAQIRAKVIQGAKDASGKPPPPAREKLRPNTHQEVDERRLGKRHSDDWAEVIGDGKTNAPESMK